MNEQLNPAQIDALKKRGFLTEKIEGLFTLRTRMPFSNYESSHLVKLSEIAEKYARGIVHVTTRQGIEIPFIKYEDIDTVEKECLDAGLKPGTSGPRLRTTTTCPGNNWCKRGLVDTFALYSKIEAKGIECALDLPHKFKIVISGCANACTRAESSEIGIHGAVDMSSGKPRFGYTVYLGGCGGKTPRFGFKLSKVYSDDEVLDIIQNVVTFFKDNAKPRQRLALLIEEIGKEAFFEAVHVEQ